MAVLFGATLSASTLAGLAGGCAAPRSGEAFAYRTLDVTQRAILDAATERIIPTTDTPGANEARVTEFVDVMLTDWYDADERSRFLDGVADMDSVSVSRSGETYAEASEAEQVDLLRTLASDAAGTPARQFFDRLKELTLVGYYTSELGMTIELQHEEVPGVFEGCVPLTEVGRAWA